ncbi:MAG: phosphopantetheine-binding protein [Acetobacteraceae bacterium]
MDSQLQTTLQRPFEQEIARLMVETLGLEMDAAEILPETPLFNEGLGLDSIDALELAMEISRHYGVELKSDDDRNGNVFASLRSLADHVEARRTS